MQHDDLPDIGFGTWPLKDEEAYGATLMALEVGYRHIDTAQMYGNEKQVGDALAASGLSEDEVFLTTKVDPSNAWGDQLVDSVRRSCDVLRRDTVDLLLLHWPPKDQPLAPAIEGLERAKALGLAHRIGVSNFTSYQLREAFSLCGPSVAVQQVEFHPLLDQEKMLTTCRELGVQLMAFSPLARGKALELAAVRSVGAAIGRSPAEVVLRWIMQRGVKLVVMSTQRDRARINLQARDFTLDDVQMAAIGSGISANMRVVNPAQWAPQWD